MLKAYLSQPLITRLAVFLLRDVGFTFWFEQRNNLTTLETHPQYPQYKWFPQVIANATHSSEHLARQLNSRINEGIQGIDLKPYIIELVENGLGIQDASDGEIQLLVDQPLLSVYTFADMISRRAVSLNPTLICLSTCWDQEPGIIFRARSTDSCNSQALGCSQLFLNFQC